MRRVLLLCLVAVLAACATTREIVRVIPCPDELLQPPPPVPVLQWVLVELWPVPVLEGATITPEDCVAEPVACVRAHEIDALVLRVEVERLRAYLEVLRAGALAAQAAGAEVVVVPPPS